MLLYQIIILALIQGLTEFLPISSSAHLILPSQLFNWSDQGLAFDVAVHVGTLVAVVFYLRSEIFQMIKGSFSALESRSLNDDAKLAMLVIIGTIPAVIIGFLIKDFVEQSLRSILVIAIASIGFGLILLWADKIGKRKKGIMQLNIKQSLIIGFAQALAFIPGTSRSGITVTAALAMGFDRQSSLKFSFLLSIPLIVAGGLLKSIDLMGAQVGADVWQEVLLGGVIAGSSAYLCIKWFMLFVDRVGMLPFVIYRVLLGLILIYAYFYVL